MKTQISIITILVSLLLLQGNASAQEKESAMDPASKRLSGWRNSLSTIKKDIADLVEENNKLNEKYGSLKKEAISLQNTINAQKVENRNLQEEIDRTERLLKKQEYTREKLRNKEGKMKDEILQYEGIGSSYNEELNDLDATIKLWELQIAELETRKKELMLELKMEENKKEEVNKGEQEIIRDLRAQLARLHDEEEEIARAVKELNANRVKTLDAVSKYEADNKVIEQEIEDLKTRKQEKIKNNLELRKDTERNKKTLEDKYPEKVRTRERLESKVSSLENKLERVKKSIEESLELQAEKRELVDQVMRLDEENQALRNRISELKQQVTALKDKSSALQAK